MCVDLWALFFFFFKQKTAYEMRISDWIQTCALPIWSAIDQALGHDEGWHHVVERRELAVPVLVAYQGQVLGMRQSAIARSEERRVGKDCVCTCSYRGPPNHSQKKM